PQSLHWLHLSPSAPCATCAGRCSHAGALSIPLRQRPSLPCCPPPRAGLPDRGCAAAQSPASPAADSASSNREWPPPGAAVLLSTPSTLRSGATPIDKSLGALPSPQWLCRCRYGDGLACLQAPSGARSASRPP